MVEVGDSNSFQNQPFIHQLFQVLSYVHIIGVTGNHVAFPMQQETFVPRFQACWPVNKEEVQEVQLQVTEWLLAGSSHRGMGSTARWRSNGPHTSPCAPWVSPDGHSRLVLILVHITLTINVTSISSLIKSLWNKCSILPIFFFSFYLDYSIE